MGLLTQVQCNYSLLLEIIHRTRLLDQIFNIQKLHSIAFPLDLNWLFFPLRLGTQRKNRCGFDWIGFRHVMKFGFFLLLAFFSYWHNMVQVEDGISSNLVLQCNLSPIFVTKQFIIKYRHRITKNK